MKVAVAATVMVAVPVTVMVAMALQLVKNVRQTMHSAISRQASLAWLSAGKCRPPSKRYHKCARWPCAGKRVHMCHGISADQCKLCKPIKFSGAGTVHPRSHGGDGGGGEGEGGMGGGGIGGGGGLHSARSSSATR